MAYRKTTDTRLLVTTFCFPVLNAFFPLLPGSYMTAFFSELCERHVEGHGHNRDRENVTTDRPIELGADENDDRIFGVGDSDEDCSSVHHDEHPFGQADHNLDSEASLYLVFYEAMVYAASLYGQLVQFLESDISVLFAVANGLTSHVAALAVFGATTRSWLFTSKWEGRHLYFMGLSNRSPDVEA